MRAHLCVCERVCVRSLLMAPFIAQPGMVPTLHTVNGEQGVGREADQKTNDKRIPFISQIY